MDTRILLIAAVLSALPGCVTETTYTGQNAASSAARPDLKAAAITRLDLAIQYLRQGNAEQAKLNLDRARQYDPDNPQVYIASAYFYQQVADDRAAEANYRQALALAPTNADALNNYGAFLCRLGRFEEAELAFLQAVAQPDYVKMADTYENAALCAMQNGRNDKASEYYRLALGYNPRNPTLLLDMAELSMKDGKLPDVQVYLDRFAAVADENEHSLWLRVRLARAQDKPALFHQFGTELVRQYPTSQQAKRYLANDY